MRPSHLFSVILALWTASVLSATEAKGSPTRGIFLKDMCSCSKIEKRPGSKCVNPAPGSVDRCSMGACSVSGYECDLNGAELCPRTTCEEWTAEDRQTEDFLFPCKSAPSECVGAPEPKLAVPRVKSALCVYSQTECSCSLAKSNPLSSCIHPRSNAAGNKCEKGNCKSGYTCDCMSPTHICKRDSICSTWVASAGADTSSDIFTCEQKEEQCTSVLSVVDEIQESPAETETANNEEERGQETARDPEVETSGEEECNLKCPHCFVSNSSCTSCIADPNLSPEEKKRCNPCKYASNDFCTRQFGLPQRFKCCDNESLCKTTLGERGVDLSNPLMVCSADCGRGCDYLTKGTCSVGRTVDLQNGGPDKVDSLRRCKIVDQE